MKKVIKILLLLLVSINMAYSQDLYFSQFYAAPLTLNPALTGFTIGDMQLGMIYRNQSNGFIPSSTYAGSCDFKIARDIIRPNMLAAGVITTIDNIASGMISSMNIMSSIAYHQSIGQYENHYIAFGAQMGLLQRKMDPNAFTYDEQWDPNTGFDETMTSYENFAKEQSLNFDFNFGMFWYSKINDNSAFYLGGSAYHILEPKESYLGEDNKLARRFVIHGGTRIGTSDEFALIPNVIVMMQNKSQQIAEGLSFEYRVRKSLSAFRLGTWYRHSDKALIFSAGFRYNSFQLGLSSDFISSVQDYTRTSGAIEFSVIYSPFFKPKSKLKPDHTRCF